MTAIVDKRVTAQLDDPFVIFVIGMRINKPWKPWKWLPVFTAMPRMIKELQGRPEAGLLGARYLFAGPLSPTMIQYWRSFEHLEAYSRSRDSRHWPAWVAFNKRIGSSGDVGIWHETYLVPAGGYESVYNNMPPTGLGAIAKLIPAAGRKASAAARAGVREEAYPADATTGQIEV